MKLIIGNKNYSSWSLRGWLAAKQSGLHFEEIQVALYGDDWEAQKKHNEDIAPSSGKVPVLWDGDAVVWDSLAIIEYLADKVGRDRFWPKADDARAMARSMVAEMHSSYLALRRECPMNIRRAPGAIDLPGGVMDDVARIETIWKTALDRSRGPFLFGAFSAADAMYAPVVNRFEAYCLTKDEAVLAYMARMKAHPAWQKWEAAARAEPWIVPEDEA